LKLEDVMTVVEAVTPKKPMARQDNKSKERSDNKGPVPEGTEKSEAPKRQGTLQEVKQASVYLQDMATSFNRKLAFAVNEQAEMVSVKVIDRETEEIIREIPSEEFVNLVARMREYIGNLFDEMV